jgi:hypothetical protein
MRKLNAGLFLATMLLFSFAGTASAQREDDAAAASDARLEGFNANVKLNGTPAAAWGLLLPLAVLALWPLFKDAKRTHLD